MDDTLSTLVLRRTPFETPVARSYGPRRLDLLPPGDAGLTRRVKAAGDHWVVRRRGPQDLLQGRVGLGCDHRADSPSSKPSDPPRASPGGRKPTPDAARRPRPSTSKTSSGRWWRSSPFMDHADLAERLARAVTDHATPVGSGTVARTKRIPVEQRAEAAVIAWMRHQTTGYDGMAIPKGQGEAARGPADARPTVPGVVARYRRGEPLGEDSPAEEGTGVEGGSRIMKERRR